MAGFSLAEVADEFGLTKPALYYYFESKEALLFELLLRGWVESATEVQSAVEGTENGADAVEQLEFLLEVVDNGELSDTAAVTIEIVDNGINGFADDVLVTEGGHRILGKPIPKTVEDVERTMAEPREFLKMEGYL